MPLALFEKLIRELVVDGYTIAGQMGFGLVGDGLLDPLVLQRTKLMRSYLPDTRLSINTNAAAYTRSKHAELAKLTTWIAVHIESLNPNVYGEVMAPLRLNRVMPKIHQILEDFPNKVVVSVPIHKLNVDEFPAIKKYFMDRGAASVNADVFSNRCSGDRGNFGTLAVNPWKHWCVKNALNELVIDSDGTVLLCCNDFERRETIGNLSHSSLRDILESERRKYIENLFDNSQTSRLKTCAECYMSYEFRRFRG
jgi:radical SAM protein with 4Fe4S-binding SPASM domain